MTAQKIRNCFRTCGFMKPIDKEEDGVPATIEVDSQWYRLSTVPVEHLSMFEDFVAINDDLAVYSFLTYYGIWNKADEEGKCSEEPSVTSKKAKSGLCAVIKLFTEK